MINKLNPWKIPTLTPEIYNELADYYSLEPWNAKLRDNPVFGRRSLIVGHDGFLNWLKLAEKGEKVALVSGFMTSGFFHLGSLAIIQQMAYYQKKYGVKIIIPIADLEARCVRKTNKSEIKKILTDFIAHFLAEDLSPADTSIYLQSRNLEVLKEASLFTAKLDMHDFEKIYDRKLSLGEAYSSLVMAADILAPQLADYKSTLITLGIDEISHFILVKKIIPMLGENFYLPSITYNKIITGLNGSKMGKSIPENSILLSDTPKEAIAKLENLEDKNIALYQNTAFDILEWFCDDDSILKNILECSNPALAKKLTINKASEVITVLLKNHQKKYKENMNLARQLTEKLMQNYG
jgi:tryptophanyl-tRNA synthetase